MDMKPFIVAFIEESRKMIDSKASLLMGEINNLRLENEALIAKCKEEILIYSEGMLRNKRYC